MYALLLACRAPLSLPQSQSTVDVAASAAPLLLLFAVIVIVVLHVCVCVRVFARYARFFFCFVVAAAAVAVVVVVAGAAFCVCCNDFECVSVWCLILSAAFILIPLLPAAFCRANVRRGEWKEKRGRERESKEGQRLPIWDVFRSFLNHRENFCTCSV